MIKIVEYKGHTIRKVECHQEPTWGRNPSTRKKELSTGCNCTYYSIGKDGRQVETALSMSVAKRRVRARVEG